MHTAQALCQHTRNGELFASAEAMRSSLQVHRRSEALRCKYTSDAKLFAASTQAMLSSLPAQRRCEAALCKHRGDAYLQYMCQATGDTLPSGRTQAERLVSARTERTAQMRVSEGAEAERGGHPARAGPHCGRVPGWREPGMLNRSDH